MGAVSERAPSSDASEPRPSDRVRAAVAVVASVAAAVAATRASGALDAPGGPLDDAGRGVVAEVIDGDTVDVDVGATRERVRLIGVDTPETVARDRPVQCYGAEASTRTAELLPRGTPVRLERDAVGRDRYGRLLAYVWRADDGLLVNLVLVEEGFADAVSYGDNEALHELFMAAEAGARARGAGLWSACGGPDVDVGPPPGEPSDG